MGGTLGNGTVFAMKTNGSGFRVIHTFTGGGDGGQPHGSLLFSSNTLYGTTYLGGAAGRGVVFSLTADGSRFAVLHAFSNITGSSGWGGIGTNPDGAHPYAGLVLSSNTLYGTATWGGAGGNGTIFSFGLQNTNFNTLHSFTVSAERGLPVARLALVTNKLYGTTGGASGIPVYAYAGCVFSMGTNGNGFVVLHFFNGDTNGYWLPGGVTVMGNSLYGATSANGVGEGIIFRLNSDGTGFTNLHSFSALSSSFTNSDGAEPHGNLNLLSNFLYGTTSIGGATGRGTIFKLNVDGTSFQPIHNFSTVDPVSQTNIDGASPNSGMLLVGNVLYGNTSSGGRFGKGTIYSLDLTPVNPPVITNQPASRTNIAGSSVLFTVGASGVGPLTYQWKKTATAIPSQTASTLSLTNVSDADAGIYSVIVSNVGGSVTSAPASLTVLDPPKITSQPLSTTNIAGTKAGFAVVATGTGPLNYQWLKGASPISQAKAASLTLTNVTDADAGIYSVIVSNTLGKVTSAGAMLTIIDPPVIKQQPFSRTNLSGTTASFSVVVGGSPPLSYQWLKGTSFLSQQKSASLTLNNLTGADAGPYRVAITNTAGAVTSVVATLTVVVRPQLMITHAGLDLVLNWSNGAIPFALQSSTNLESPTNWTTVFPAAQDIGGLSTTTNAFSGGQVFYRLSN